MRRTIGATKRTTGKATSQDEKYAVIHPSRNCEGCSSTLANPKFLRLDTPEITRDIKPESKKPNTTLGSHGIVRSGRMGGLLQNAQVAVDGPFTSGGLAAAAAIRFTGLPAMDLSHLPDIVAMSSEQITAQICPEKPSSCQTLIALYEPTKRRILYRNSLNMKLVKDQSFILHELVHVLQYALHGDAVFGSCKATMESEGQAYRAQDRYLGEKGEEYRVGGLFRFIRCEDSSNRPAPLGR